MKGWKKKAIDDLLPPRKRVQVTSQVLERTHEVLAELAKESGQSVSAVAAAVLDDYAAWVRDSERKA